jgi:hypothetical protein
MIELAGLLVERVVVHPMPRKEPRATEEQQGQLALSEGLATLGDTLRHYMNVRLLETLQSVEKAFDVVFDNTNATLAAPGIRAYLCSEATEEVTAGDREESLVAFSRSLATKLFEVQPPGPPPSLFVVCTGSIAHTPFLAVMKLEHERGVTAEERFIGGKRTYEMSVEERLVLVSGTRIFKAALFSPRSRQDVLDTPQDFVIDGRLSDNQNPFTTSGVADYFLSRLLGLKLKEEPRIQTEQVFKAIENFLNTEVEDTSERVKAERALLVDLASNRTVFSAQRFGNENLHANTRRSLRQYLTDKGFPTAAFPKDNELIIKRLNMIALEFEGRITVVAPEDKFDDEIIQVVGTEGAGDTVVTIRAPLRRTGSRGR